MTQLRGARKKTIDVKKMTEKSCNLSEKLKNRLMLRLESSTLGLRLVLGYKNYFPNKLVSNVEVFADYSHTTFHNLVNSSLNLNKDFQEQPPEEFCK